MTDQIFSIPIPLDLVSLTNFGQVKDFIEGSTCIIDLQPFLFDTEKYESQSYLEAIKFQISRTNNLNHDSPEVQFVIACLLYIKVIGLFKDSPRIIVQQNKELAVQIWKRLSNENHAQSSFILGVFFLHIQRSLTSGVKWLDRASCLGHTMARHLLGNIIWVYNDSKLKALKVWSGDATCLSCCSGLVDGNETQLTLSKTETSLVQLYESNCHQKHKIITDVLKLWIECLDLCKLISQYRIPFLFSKNNHSHSSQINNYLN